MGYDEFILTVNAASVIILLMMAFVLSLASRFKGESSYATLIIVLTTVPVYIYNVCRSLGWYKAALFFSPLALSVNLTLMPLLWMLAHRGFNPCYRFTFLKLLHFMPALLSFVFFGASIFSLPADRQYDFMMHENTGDDTWLGDVNYLLLLAQVAGYFFAIFRYLRGVRRYICNYYSATELKRKVWIPRFIALFAAMFAVVMVAYGLWPRTDAWLPQLLTVVIMGYLLYAELTITFSERSDREVIPEAVVAEAQAEFLESREKPRLDPDNRKDDTELLRQYARQVEEYLQASGVYVNPNLSLKEVADAVGISSRNLSRAINNVLDKNFFDLVNGFRVEKSMELLRVKKEKGLTLETIAEQCGFNSQVTYCNAFKKIMGMTTTQWLKLVGNK